MKTNPLQAVYIGLFFGTALFLNTCSKNEGDDLSFEEAIKHEAMTDEQVAYYDNQD